MCTFFYTVIIIIIIIIIITLCQRALVFRLLIHVGTKLGFKLHVHVLTGS